VTPRTSAPALLPLTRRQSYQLGRRDRLDPKLTGLNVYQCCNRHRDKKLKCFHLHIHEYQNGWFGAYDEDMSSRYEDVTI
jgi:hypothetical protein